MKFLITALVILGTTKLCLLMQFPEYLPYGNWLDMLMTVHLNNMTSELVRDVDYKINLLEYYQRVYEDRPSYRLGVIASSITDLFSHMLFVYRMYTDLSTYPNEPYNIYDYMHALYVIQNDYNELRVQHKSYLRVQAEQTKIYIENAKRRKKEKMKRDEIMEKKAEEKDLKGGPKKPTDQVHFRQRGALWSYKERFDAGRGGNRALHKAGGPHMEAEYF